MKKLNLTRHFLNSLPVDERLPFGIVGNLRVTKIFTGDKFNKNSERYGRNCYITFSQFDDDGKMIAETIFDYWDISTPAYAKANFIHQMVQLTEILKYSVPKEKSAETVEAFEQAVNGFSKELAVVFDNKIEESDLVMINSLMKKVSIEAEKLLSPYYKETEKVQLIVACSKDGKYLNLPTNESKGFIAYTDSEPLKMPTKYLSFIQNKDKVKKDTSDVIGATEDIVVQDEVLPELDDNLEDSL